RCRCRVPGGPRWLHPVRLGARSACHQHQPLQALLSGGGVRSPHRSPLGARAKANPGKITYGSQGVGSTPNLNAVMFMNMTGTQFVHIPYRGETLVVNDMLGGHVDMFFGNISPVLPPYRDG